MSTTTHRGYRGPFGDMAEWMEAPWTVLRPVTANPMRAEDFVADGRYVVRAELPGVDPESDIEVTASGRNLTIRAERREEKDGKHRSEFRYGTFSRSFTLPDGADLGQIDATYDNGILEITIPLAEKDKAVRKVPVRLNQHIRPS